MPIISPYRFVLAVLLLALAFSPANAAVHGTGGCNGRATDHTDADARDVGGDKSNGARAPAPRSSSCVCHGARPRPPSVRPRTVT
jgi:hypothetical protein